MRKPGACGNGWRAISIKGAMNAEIFKTYVEDFLAPTLKAGEVVVLDRLRARTESG